MAKVPDPVDKHVGSRVRMCRLMRDISQGALANQLGLTFQQIQKYEKGINRISASRLQHLANILHVSVPFFFEGAPNSEAKTTAIPAEITEFLSTADGLVLARAFTSIASAKVRHRLVQLVEEIAETKSGE